MLSLINPRSHNLLQYSVVQILLTYYLIPVKVIHMSIKFMIHIHYSSLLLISGFRQNSPPPPPRLPLLLFYQAGVDGLFRLGKLFFPVFPRKPATVQVLLR